MSDGIDMDQELHDALRAEADEVVPDTDAAWQRLAAVDGGRGRWIRRPVTLLTVGAIAAAVAVVVALVAVPGDEQAVDSDLAGDPSTTIASEEPTTSMVPPTTVPVVPPVPAEPPQLYAVVMEDGRLVLLDRDGHVQRELAFHGDPRVEDEVGMTYFIDAVDISSDGQWVYYSTCCEPAVGSTYRVPTTGGESQKLPVDGSSPAVSPNGEWVAVGTYGVIVTTADGDVVASHDLDCCTRGLVWSPDSARVAYVSFTGLEDDPGPVVIELAFDGRTLTPIGEPRPGSFAHYLPDGQLMVLDPANPTGLAQLSTDASNGWILELTESSELRYRSADALDSPPAILGSGYIAAGW